MPNDLFSFMRAAPRLARLLNFRHSGATDESNKSILHYLIKEEEEEIAKTILRNRNINPRDGYRPTPLSYIAEEGYAALVD